ncbi:alpha-beta hydrolase superfamily lysophospholipase [Caulobacter sp. BE264]|uniref:alpha/beta hydrolase n=1 Tax=Caulobacter sp. BE264 TaxID=2817724 RepID=UPI0028657E6F|nr:alpha/beta hydrolase [Caulobacter sp. BE264]MDR7229181.1 alpha-beta hydrolase superfamily lysophospholipase [Caulobacter sp. BE264]
MNRRALILTASAAALSACAPLRQRPELAALGFRGPRLTDQAFVSFDGAQLGLMRWLPASEPDWVIVGLHGMNDYANAYHLAAAWWAGRGIATYALDVRGFGRSPERGVWAPADLVIEDVRLLVEAVRERHPNAKIALAGISMGGALAISAMSTQSPPRVDKVLLFAPAVWGWSNQPLPNKLSLWITAHTKGDWVVKPPEWLVRNVMPSDNLDELRRMGRDPLMIWGARSDTLYGLVGLMERAWRSPDAIATRVAWFYGANDHIIPREPTVEAVSRLRPGARTAYYPKGYHLLLVDQQAEAVWADAVAFLRDAPGAWPPSGVPAIPSSLAAMTALDPPKPAKRKVSQGQPSGL